MLSGWDPEPIIHSICAFANDIDNFSDGYIFIGVEEENRKLKFPIARVDVYKKEQDIKRIISENGEYKHLLEKYNQIVF